VSLRQTEQDDEEVLRAEDEAIALTERADPVTHTIPTGQALADMIERLANADVQR
jgi:hypothetical protein